MKKIKFIGLIFVIIGILYFSYKIFIYVKIIKTNKEELTTYFRQYNNLGNKIETNEKSDYLMVLEIPKISLKQGIYAKDDLRNNINQNVSILSDSIKLDNQNSLLILAAHSGNSIYSYFQKLKQLQLNDQAIIYYEGRIYIYKISKIYEMSKDTSMLIPKIKDNKIILITCLDNETYLIIEAKGT